MPPVEPNEFDAPNEDEQESPEELGSASGPVGPQSAENEPSESEPSTSNPSEAFAPTVPFEPVAATRSFEPYEPMSATRPFEPYDDAGSLPEPEPISRPTAASVPKPARVPTPPRPRFADRSPDPTSIVAGIVFFLLGGAYLLASSGHLTVNAAWTVSLLFIGLGLAGLLGAALGVRRRR